MSQIRFRPFDEKAGTHVLIIGVGYYRHLRGGPEPRTSTHMGLNVLHSPSISAMHIARWMVNGNGSIGGGLNNPDAPLTTLEVFVSSKQGEQLEALGVTHEIEPASLPRIRDGFDRWLDEVTKNPKNVGVLYFCGHGVMGIGSEQFLLLEDYGQSKNRPFQTGSFDITNTVRALMRQVPAQLYIFVDACRTYSRYLGERLGRNPAPLLEDGASSENVNLGITTVYSTTEGEPAFADSSGLSRFTSALMQALGGYCGAPQPGTHNWIVNGSALTYAMPKLLAVVNKERGGDPQSCAPQPSGAIDTPLHVTTRIPKVKVEIELSPHALRSGSSFSIHNLIDRSATPITGGQSEGVWHTEADKGIYEVRIASDKREAYVSGTEHFEPPHYHLPVQMPL